MRRTNVSNHISFPSPGGIEPPDALLRGLRQVDETMDCHYLGEGRWVVGSVRPTSHRRRIAGGMLARDETRDDPIKATFALLAFHGLAPWSAYEFRGKDYGHVLRDVRKRDWQYRNRAEEAFEEAFEASTHHPGSRSESEMMDDIEDRIRAYYPYLFKGRKHFT